MALSAHMESTKEKHMESTKEKTHGEHQRENTWRPPKRKHKKSTEEKQGEHQRERDLENIELI